MRFGQMVLNGKSFVYMENVLKFDPERFETFVTIYRATVEEKAYYDSLSNYNGLNPILRFFTAKPVDPHPNFPANIHEAGRWLDSLAGKYFPSGYIAGKTGPGEKEAKYSLTFDSKTLQPKFSVQCYDYSASWSSSQYYSVYGLDKDGCVELLKNEGTPVVGQDAERQLGGHYFLSYLGRKEKVSDSDFREALEDDKDFAKFLENEQGKDVVPGFEAYYDTRAIDIRLKQGIEYLSHTINMCLSDNVYNTSATREAFLRIYDRVHHMMFDEPESLHIFKTGEHKRSMDCYFDLCKHNALPFVVGDFTSCSLLDGYTKREIKTYLDTHLFRYLDDKTKNESKKTMLWVIKNTIMRIVGDDNINKYDIQFQRIKPGRLIECYYGDNLQDIRKNADELLEKTYSDAKWLFNENLVKNIDKALADGRENLQELGATRVDMPKLDYFGDLHLYVMPSNNAKEVAYVFVGDQKAVSGLEHCIISVDYDNSEVKICKSNYDSSVDLSVLKDFVKDIESENLSAGKEETVSRGLHQ